MPTYIVLAAMKGRFVSEFGNTYDNIQMMGYVSVSAGASPQEAVGAFFDQPRTRSNGQGRRVPVGRASGRNPG